MCKCLTRGEVKRTGLVFTILFGLTCIPCIVIAGLNYWYTDLSWQKDGAWRYLSGLQVGAVVSVFFVFMMGVANFTCGKECKTFQIIFSILLILCTLLALGVGIVVLIGGTIDKNNLSKSCQIHYKGMFEDFLKVDKLLTNADNILCTEKCPCYFTDDGVYQELTEKYQNGIVRSDKGGFKSIKECYDKKGDVAGFTLEGSIIKNNKQAKKFMKYWKRIEEKFDCAGWCTKPMKYLFSDVNRGIPDHKCSTEVTGWVIRMVLAFGGLMVITSGIMIIVILLAISDFADLTKNGPMYPPKEEIQNIKYSGNEKETIGNPEPIMNSNDKQNINEERTTIQ